MITNSIIKISFSIIILIFVSSPFVIDAQGINTQNQVKNEETKKAEKPAGNIIACSGTDCNWAGFIKTINNFIDFLFRLAVSLATISFAFAGFLYLTAGDDTGKTQRARDIFKKVIIGFIFMAVAWLLVKTLLSIADPSFSGLE